MIARFQFWLQHFEWWPACWLGNRVSDVRYWAWRVRGSKWPETKGPTITIDTRYENTTSNTGERP